MSVWLLPAAKSVVAPSVRTMVPSDVNAAPLVEFKDLSVEMFCPPVGWVIATLANRWVEYKPRAAKTRRGRIEACFRPPPGQALTLVELIHLPLILFMPDWPTQTIGRQHGW